jgi:TonB family protein
MMAKGKSLASQKLRFLALVPVASVLFFAFSCEKEDMNPKPTSLADFPEIIEVPLTVEDIQVVPYVEPNENNRALADPVLDADEIFDVVEQQPNPAGGMSGWNSYLSQNLQYPQKARELGIEGTVIVVFEIHKDGSIHQVEILRGIGGGADEEAVRVVQNAPKWEPGRQRGRAVKTRMRLPIRFKMASSTGTNSEIITPSTSKVEFPEGPQSEVNVVAYSSPKNFERMPSYQIEKPKNSVK